MQFPGVEARPLVAPPALAIAATLLLATPGGARAQSEWTLGPFVGFTEAHAGKPSSAGLQTTVIAGPVGLRVSGFSAIAQSPSAWSASGEPRFGGDADLMLVLDNVARRGSGVGLAPYVFAGASLTLHDELSDYSGFSSFTTRPARGWSYGGGLLVPFGRTAELMGEIRARPAGFFNSAAMSAGATQVEYRVGLSLRLDNLFARGRGSGTPNGRRSTPRRSSEPLEVILGTVGEAAGSTAPAGSAARIVPTAERYLGTPYRYGGTSPITGFDCSGFVQYVFARNAVKLPRTSRQQAKVGVALPRNFRALSPGDLVMFAERGEPISHVAIYAGNNRIIHATASGGEVRYDDLRTHRGQWFVDHMVAARRVTPNAHGLMLDLVRMLDAKSLVDTALDIGDFAPKR